MNVPRFFTARPATHAPSETSQYLRVAAIAAATALAFASPVIGPAARITAGSDEARLSRLLVGAFGALSTPVIGAAVAALVFGGGAPLRRRVDRLVAAGATPIRAIARTAVVAVAVGAIAAGSIAALVDVVLRARLGLAHGSIVVVDALATFEAVALAVAAWTAIGIAVVSRNGRGGRAFFIVGFDLSSRLLPGAAAWLAPSMHLGNLLGAPPFARTVPIPVVSQPASLAALVLVTIAAIAVGLRLYEGAPSRR